MKALGLIITLISTNAMPAELTSAQAPVRRAVLAPHRTVPVPRPRVTPVVPAHPHNYDRIAHDKAWMAEAVSSGCKNENDTCTAERELAWQEFLLRKYLRFLRDSKDE